MKIRIKFAKRGAMKFISHLDVMRYFQKVIKRANIDIAYSEGFNPHQIMSFASPLGVGLESEAEYVDIEVHSTMSSSDAIKVMNDVSVADIPILSYRLLEDNATKAMTLVSAAKYFVSFREEYMPKFDFDKAIDEFMSKNSFVITKETKKGHKDMDIRPLVYEIDKVESGYVMTLCAGSVDNLKPELLFESIYSFNNEIFNDISLEITRLEMYGNDNGKLIPLSDYATEII